MAARTGDIEALLGIRGPQLAPLHPELAKALDPSSTLTPDNTGIGVAQDGSVGR